MPIFWPYSSWTLQFTFVKLKNLSFNSSLSFNFPKGFIGASFTKSTLALSIATISFDANIPKSGTIDISLQSQQSQSGVILIRKFLDIDFIKNITQFLYNINLLKKLLFISIIGTKFKTL